jgi:hypothetical protein
LAEFSGPLLRAQELLGLALQGHSVSNLLADELANITSDNLVGLVNLMFAHLFDRTDQAVAEQFRVAVRLGPLQKMPRLSSEVERKAVGRSEMIVAGFTTLSGASRR